MDRSAITPPTINYPRIGPLERPPTTVTNTTVPRNPSSAPISRVADLPPNNTTTALQQHQLDHDPALAHRPATTTKHHQHEHDANHDQDGPKAGLLAVEVLLVLVRGREMFDGMPRVLLRVVDVELD